MGLAEDNFAFRFIFEDKEEGTSKVVGSFTSQTGTFTIKSKLRYGLGSVSSEQLHQVAMGMTKSTTSTVVPMRRFA